MLPQGWLRFLTDGGRKKYAATLWLQPTRPRWDIKQLMKHAGYDFLTLPEFASHLKTSCLDIASKYWRFSHWVHYRAAVLDHFIDASPGSHADDMDKPKALLQRYLMEVIALKADGQPDSLEKAAVLAEYCLDRALNLLGIAVGAYFNEPKSVKPKVSVNLMVPCGFGTGGTSLENAVGTDNYDRAKDLWKHLSSSSMAKRLVVVAETSEQNEHLGFWVPVMKDTNPPRLPGATEAFQERHPTSVFKVDLPPLRDFPDGLRTAWHNYMQQHFLAKLFVSMPLVLHDGRDALHTAAVANINFSPSDAERADDRWLRAFHRICLEEAQASAGSLLKIAFVAHQLRALCRPGSFPNTSIGAPLWDRILMSPPGLAGGNPLPLPS